jgi:hypothetical protein
MQNSLIEKILSLRAISLMRNYLLPQQIQSCPQAIKNGFKVIEGSAYVNGELFHWHTKPPAALTRACPAAVSQIQVDPKRG